MTHVYVLTLHDGAYSDYSCSLLAVTATLDGAQRFAQSDQDGARLREQRRQDEVQSLYRHLLREIYIESLVWQHAVGDDSLETKGESWTATSTYDQTWKREGDRYYLINRMDLVE